MSKKTSAHLYNPGSHADELWDHIELLSHLLRILEPREKNSNIPNTVLSVLSWCVHAATDVVKNILHHHLISKRGLSTAGVLGEMSNLPLNGTLPSWMPCDTADPYAAAPWDAKLSQKGSELSRFHLSILLNCCFSKCLLVTWNKWFSDREE